MDIWCDRHASVYSFVLRPLCYTLWSVQSCSLLIATNSVHVLVTYRPIVIGQMPSQKTPNLKKLEISKRVTRKLCSSKSHDIWCPR